MKKRLICMLACGVLILTGTVFPLDYFGDIEANRLLLMVESAGHPLSELSGQRFPFFLALHEGVPILCDSNEFTDPDASIERGHLEIMDLVEMPPSRRESGETKQEFWERIKDDVKKTQQLIFEFERSGWSSDSYVVRIEVPYSLEPGDKLRMLRFSQEASLQTLWHDPKNDAIDVVSYWPGVGARIPVKVTVLESTLGFGNKLTTKSRDSIDRPAGAPPGSP